MAVRNSDGRIKQAEVIVNLRDGAHGGSGAAAGGLLLYGNGWAEALNGVHVRPLHLVEELARVSGKGLNVAPLAFGINNVERQARFAGAAQSRHHAQGVARNL